MGVGLPGSAANEFPPGCYLPGPKLFWRRRFAGVWVRAWTVSSRGTELQRLCSSMDSRRGQLARSVDDCRLFGFPWLRAYSSLAIAVSRLCSSCLRGEFLQKTHHGGSEVIEDALKGARCLAKCVSSIW